MTNAINISSTQPINERTIFTERLEQLKILNSRASSLTTQDLADNISSIYNGLIDENSDIIFQLKDNDGFPYYTTNIRHLHNYNQNLILTIIKETLSYEYSLTPSLISLLKDFKKQSQIESTIKKTNKKLCRSNSPAHKNLLNKFYNSRIKNLTSKLSTVDDCIIITSTSTGYSYRGALIYNRSTNTIERILVKKDYVFGFDKITSELTSLSLLKTLLEEIDKTPKLSEDMIYTTSFPTLNNLYM